MRERCTIDSSCIIALDHLDLLPKVSLLFSRVLVPRAVRQDLFKRRATKNRLRSLFDSYAFFERCDDYDKGAVDSLHERGMECGTVGRLRGPYRLPQWARPSFVEILGDVRWLRTSILSFTAPSGFFSDSESWN
jgi:hypothetical protein